MDGWIGILLFVGFFFLMMRFGCGAHMAHGHGSHNDHNGHDDHNGHNGHDDHNGHNGHDGHDGHESSGGIRPYVAEPADAFDPVCGMVVRPGEGYGMAYGGREHRFCSRDCLDRFEADPARYTNAAAESLR